jgi:L-rhamnose mutarotase
MFEMRDMRSIKFFLEIKIIQTIDLIYQTIESIYLIQNIYIDKLIKNYAINTKSKASFIFFSIKDIKSFDEDVDQFCMHEYRKKMRSICYSAIISRSDIVKVVSKLTKHLISFE